MSKTVVLLGYPLGHSLSPVFQQAAFDYYQMDTQYELREVSPDDLDKVVNSLREPSYPGANVTIPHKQSVIPMMDDLDVLASEIGAVNTIVNRSGRLVGYNTDASGFIKALRQEGGFEPQKKSVVLLGAGGVARAIGFALVKAGVSSIDITEKLMPDNAIGIKSSLESLGGIQVNVFKWDETLIGDAVSHCDLLVNCTPMGMKHSPDEQCSPVSEDVIPSTTFVYDVVYNPADTVLLRKARSAGAAGLGGLSMLVYQGAVSFELWTGKDAPVELMMETARKALG
ncbi:MAG: shikimate dehydrogenase [Chloroflexota bacterium]|nr:shikimate dehydrogenase [Chloroflexota bacterium]